MSIDAVRGRVVSCTLCPLCETRTNAVPGAGDPRADVVFIGEAPGRSEDARGEPFVGAAGRILVESLARAGVQRRQVYITNVVKCRPPKNRVPRESEREACSAYLEAELDAIDPAMICIMGNTAFGSVLGGSEITKHRGTVAKKGGRLYYITVHPAAAIYNPGLVDVLDSDLARMFALVGDLKAGKEVPVDAELA